MAQANRKPQATIQTAAPTSAMASTLATIAAAPVVANPAAAVKAPAVVYTNGLAPNAPANAVLVAFGGQSWQGTLAATNPAHKGVVGNAKPGTVTLGSKPAGPRAGHNVAMFAAIAAVLPCTSQQAAQAAGSGGAAFVAYAVRCGWLALAK